MTIFRLKQLASTSAHAAAGAMRWNYDRAELIADGVVHGIGVFGGLIAATVLIVLAAVYASAARNRRRSRSMPRACWRCWAFRRPIISGRCRAQMAAAPLRSFGDLHADRRDLHAVHHAIEGQRLRDVAAGRRLVRRRWSASCSSWFCPAGSTGSRSGFIWRWAGAASCSTTPVVAALPAVALWFIVAGGVLYSFGVIFHAWQRLRFQNVIWHCFVLLGAACHYTAVLDLVLA